MNILDALFKSKPAPKNFAEAYKQAKADAWKNRLGAMGAGMVQASQPAYGLQPNAAGLYDPGLLNSLSYGLEQGRKGQAGFMDNFTKNYFMRQQIGGAETAAKRKSFENKRNDAILANLLGPGFGGPGGGGTQQVQSPAERSAVDTLGGGSGDDVISNMMGGGQYPNAGNFGGGQKQPSMSEYMKNLPQGIKAAMALAIASGKNPGSVLASYANKTPGSALGAGGFRRYAGGPKHGQRMFPGVEKPQYSGEVKLDEQVGKWYQTNPGSGKREYITPNEEFMIEKVGDNFYIRKGPTGGGGAGDMTRSMKTQLQKGAFSNQTAIDRMNYINALYEPEFLSRQGQGRAAFMDEWNRWSPGKRDAFTARRAAFLSQANQAFIAYRKWATGVAGGEKEMAEIKRATFSEEDSPQAFEAKIAAMKQMTKKLLVRQAMALQEGVKVGSTGWKDFLQRTPLEGIPTAKERGETLYKMGYKEKQIIEILRTEGYASKRKHQ